MPIQPPRSAKFADDLDRLSGSSADAAAAQLSNWQRIFVAEIHGLLDQFSPGAVDLSAMPRQLRSHYVSDDGIYALYIYPAKDLWNDADLNEFESSVESLVAKVPGAPHVTGIASNVFHTTGAIHDAFFDTTVYALALIFVLVLLDFRRARSDFRGHQRFSHGFADARRAHGIVRNKLEFREFLRLADPHRSGT